MELSQQDQLRVNVLLHQDLYAVRIDEPAMVLHALTEKGEAKIALNPTCRDDKYLRIVKELLSTHVLGTPGGYPIFLKRWTRMGQMRDESLKGLLLLGEPEAIIAVAHAKGITEEIARNTWWAMPTADIARRLLEHEAVASCDFGKELAAYLLEFLPFESDAQPIVDSVRLVLQPKLIDYMERQSLWKKAARKSAIFIGFLIAIPDDLPDRQPAHTEYDKALVKLSDLVSSDNWFAIQLLKTMSPAGQTFLHTVEKAIAKLNTADATIALAKAVGAYYSGHEWCDQQQFRFMHEAQGEIESHLDSQPNSACQAILSIDSDYRSLLHAIMSLAIVGEDLLNPIFAQTDAVGSVMRKKIKPATDPILQSIQQLRTN